MSFLLLLIAHIGNCGVFTDKQNSRMLLVYGFLLPVLLQLVQGKNKVTYTFPEFPYKETKKNVRPPAVSLAGVLTGLFVAGGDFPGSGRGLREGLFGKKRAVEDHLRETVRFALLLPGPLPAGPGKFGAPHAAPIMGYSFSTFSWRMERWM